MGTTRRVLVALLGLVFAGTAVPALGQVSRPGLDNGAHTQLELRLGMFGHDLTVGNIGAGGAEDGENLTMEAVLPSPAALRFLGKPRPYAQFSMNSASETNFGGVGLVWQTPRTRGGLFGEFGFGVVVHDGVLDVTDRAPSDPYRIETAQNRVLFGSRDLFRSTFALGTPVNSNWDLTAVFEHLSHGQILGSGRNQGLDTVGVRFARKFGR